VDRSWKYINRSQTHECRNWDRGRTIPRKGIHKCSAYLFHCPNILFALLRVCLGFLCVFPYPFHILGLVALLNIQFCKLQIFLANSLLTSHGMMSPHNQRHTIWLDGQ
jgi:hypothetical protein